MGRFDGPAVLRDEAGARALLEALYGAVAGRVVAADACHRRTSTYRIVRAPGGERAVSSGERVELGCRLVGAGGRRLDLALSESPPEEAAAAVRVALPILDAAPPDPGFSLAPVPERGRRHFAPLRATDPRDLDPETLLGGLVDELEALAAAAAPEGATLEPVVDAWLQVEDKIVSDLEGLWRTQTLPRFYLEVELVARAGGRTGRFVARCGDLGGPEGLLTPLGHVREPWATRLRAGMSAAVGLLGARPLPASELAGLTHYVVDPSALAAVIHPIAHGFEADRIRSGGSPFFARDGVALEPRLAAAGVRLVDGPLPGPEDAPRTAHGFGTAFIDDEGVEVGPVTLIEDGRVAGRLHTRETAAVFGEVPNGRAFGDGGEAPLVRATNPWIGPAGRALWHARLDDLLAGVPLGVLLLGAEGAQVDGEAAVTRVQAARLVRDGGLTDEWVAPGAFVARPLDVLAAIDGFQGDARAGRPGFCSKAAGGRSHAKPVAYGGCTTRLRARPGLRLAW